MNQHEWEDTEEVWNAYWDKNTEEKAEESEKKAQVQQMGTGLVEQSKANSRFECKYDRPF